MSAGWPCEVTDVQNSATDRLSGKFATKSYLNTPSHLQNVAIILLCERRMSQNCRQSEICIVINDKSQGSVDKHLFWDGLLYYRFIIQFLVKELFY